MRSDKRHGERRKWPRLPLAIPVFVRSRDDKGKEFLEFATALNVSAGGMLLAVRKGLPAAAEVLLEIPSAPMSGLTALPKTARRLCESWTAHATCRQLNRHPNEFRPLPSRRAPAGCELDQAGLTADNRPSRRPADSCLAIYLPWPKSKSLLTAQVASD